MRRAPAVALAALLASSCGAGLMKLPPEPGTPATDAREALAEATTACNRVLSLTAEIAVSGSVGGQRLRATLNVGVLHPDLIRLEAFALGQPIFLFVARGADATLLLRRDNRVLEHGPPDAILQAVTGVPLKSFTLKTLLTGCTTTADWGKGQELGPDWRLLPDIDGAVYLHRAARQGAWQLVAARHRDPAGGEWRADYRDPRDGVPGEIRLTSADQKRFDLRLVLSQVETQVTLEPEALLRVQIPPSADPITLEELRRAGPLGISSSNSSDGR